MGLARTGTRITEDKKLAAEHSQPLVFALHGSEARLILIGGAAGITPASAHLTAWSAPATAVEIE